MSKDEMRASIRDKFDEIRKDIKAYQREYNEFYPGLFDGAPTVPRKELCAPCRLVPDRLDIIRNLPVGGRFAEVGTLFGDFIVKVIEIIKPSELHLFDLGFQNIRPEHRAKLDLFGNVTYHIGDSSQELAKIDDGFFDVVYVDGDHSYEGVWKDLLQSLRVLKSDGYLICNDYTNWDPIQCTPYGVLSAVNRFANENNLEFAFMGLAAMGFHDVALQRSGHAR